ncbi:MAG: adenosylcobinamide-GDP ribazoletransferase [Raineya sp.]|nr:adenosylcobinamide-GDP ribazoletransferase [Raineya sp.]MDW8297402.1 adenosylcobinamide-GDP ribazoletransferase [Raineya sp.]
MKEQIKIFWVALMFYTRIPCPKHTEHTPEYLNKATRFFPLIGWIVGSISFVVFWLSYQVFDENIAVVFSLSAGVLVTGAFHEDGFADTFDGFGGGWTKTKILEIMKDSRIGTYGVIALIFLFLLKFLALQSIFTKANNIWLVLLVFVAYHSLARMTAANIIFVSQYARDDEKSKVKPIAQSYGNAEIIGVYVFGLFPLAILSLINVVFVAVLILLVGLFAFAKRYFEKWIGGYTGDCLGAVEQIAECLCLLFFASIWRFM